MLQSNVITYQTTDSIRLKNLAMTNIIKGMKGLVIKFAKKYSFGSTELFEENIHIGNISLLEALEKYDVSRGTAFSTFAYYYIIKDIDLHCQHLQMIRIPANIRNDILRTKKGKKDLEALQEYENMNNTVSIHYEDSEGNSLELPQTTFKCPHKKITVSITINHLNNILKQIDNVGAGIVVHYVGYGRKILGLEALGRKYNMSPEGIRLKKEKTLIIMKKLCKQQGIDIQDVL
jgi:RNA polymerase sigma factor (sigma-70 family)